MEIPIRILPLYEGVYVVIEYKQIIGQMTRVGTYR